ncbi:unnamed protein product [Didymodactylos carnosus]|uniref:Protein kinase domain-containing protein n=1 Tax=Didymodactylos carnosus TaxID=1234261 RepID=A0A8S2E989_9BILA|nr:unnamed protein product [Didymodactylos carnosus]CAF3971607.1 unnamed protein product [Didymodactylos carnosus]
MITSDERKQPTLIDFGLAHIHTDDSVLRKAENLSKEESEEIDKIGDDIDFVEISKIQTQLGERMGNTYYQVPQLISAPANVQDFQTLILLRRSPNIDTTSVAAILFGLLTNMCPQQSRNDNDKAPHQISDARERINKKVQATDRSDRDKKRMRNYLLHTFDKAFANLPMEQWTDELLHLRLQQIDGLIKLESLPDHNPPKIKPTSLFDKQTKADDPFLKTALAFAYCKRLFSSTYPIYHRSHNGCEWDNHDSPIKRTSTDEITCTKFAGPYKIIFLADIFGEELVLTLVCENMHASLERYDRKIRAFDSHEFYESFETELLTLIEHRNKTIDQRMMALNAKERENNKNNV